MIIAREIIEGAGEDSGFYGLSSFPQFVNEVGGRRIEVDGKTYIAMYKLRPEMLFAWEEANQFNIAASNYIALEEPDNFLVVEVPQDIVFLGSLIKIDTAELSQHDQHQLAWRVKQIKLRIGDFPRPYVIGYALSSKKFYVI